MHAFRHFLLAGSLAGLVVPGPAWHAAAVRTGSVEGTVRDNGGGTDAPLKGSRPSQLAASRVSGLSWGGVK
jgi:hypothetical protein